MLSPVYLYYGVEACAPKSYWRSGTTAKNMPLNRSAFSEA